MIIFVSYSYYNQSVFVKEKLTLTIDTQDCHLPFYFTTEKATSREQQYSFFRIGLKKSGSFSEKLN